MKKSLLLCALIAVAVWLGNTSRFHAPDDTATPRLIAHRGLHHVFTGEGRNNDTCRANRLEPIQHAFIENTIPSMRAAFAAGADVVELDVHLTPDKVFAVFHDWRLECQTNGEGVTEEQPFSVLKSLDIAYNLSDDGVTFPLRGQGVGLMPSLLEVFAAELDGRYLVNFKSRRKEEGTALLSMLDNAAVREQVFAVYGGGPPTRAVLAARPDMIGFDRQHVKDCLLRYALVGWFGRVPDACRSGLIGVPMNVAPWLWGWPHRFVSRLRAAGTEVVLWGPYDGSGFSSGIDDADTFARVPAGFDGYLWTNKIELIGPLVTSQRGD